MVIIGVKLVTLEVYFCFLNIFNNFSKFKTDLNCDMGEITEEDVQNSLSELERNALERRKRLKNIRAQLSIRNQENGTSEAVNTEDQERDG